MKLASSASPLNRSWLTAASRLFIACLAAATPCIGKTLRERISLDADWRFQLSDHPEAAQPDFRDTEWRALNLPHDWAIEGRIDHAAATTGQGGFLPSGIGWYRHTFNAPESWRGQKISIEFEGVYHHAEVWINGHNLGLHPYGYTPFEYELSPYLKLGAANTLAVRVDNSQHINSRWFSGSGIYRHVWLHVRPVVQIAPQGLFVSTTEIHAPNALVRSETTVRNTTSQNVTASIEVRLLDPRDHEVARTRIEAAIPAGAEHTATATVSVPQAQLWSPESPTLYRAVARVLVDNKKIDELTSSFGIRTVHVSAQRGFELNGKSIKLAGGNLHHDHGPLGAASYDVAEFRRVQQLKAAGFNAVRTSHNPPATAFLDACDQLGLLVLDEAFDCWEKPKNPHDYSKVFKDWSLRDIDAMVRRDRNHPSVIMWSIGNEVYERGSASGLRVATALTQRIRSLDTTRPITAGLNGMGKNGDWTKLDPVFSTLDVAGYNYEIQRHAADHARLPERVILTTESYQAETFLQWAAAHDYDYVIGDFVWTALDYLGEAGIGQVFTAGKKPVPHWESDQWPAHGAYCGDIDFTGLRKPISHYRNIVWDRGEKLYAAVRTPALDGLAQTPDAWGMPPSLPSWTWPGHEGKPLQLEVFSRHAAVRVYLADRLIAEKPTTRAEEFKTLIEIPYTPGKLRIVGLDNGKEIESITLTTASAPAKLRLTTDRTKLLRGGQDLAFITVEITDRDGLPRFDHDQPVTYTVHGPAELVGFASGDLSSQESYRDNPRRTYQGRASVVIRTTAASGKITLTATAPGLTPATITLRATSSR